MTLMRCAVWYWTHGSTGFWTFDTEDAAVRTAAVYDESYAVAGVEFEDGTYIRREDWPALKAYEEEQTKRAWEEGRSSSASLGMLPPPPVVTEVRPPFDGPAARTTSAVPDWLRARR